MNCRDYQNWLQSDFDGAAGLAAGSAEHRAACHRSAELARGERDSRDLFRPAPGEEKAAEVVPLPVRKEKIVTVAGLVKHFRGHHLAAVILLGIVPLAFVGE